MMREIFFYLLWFFIFSSNALALNQQFQLPIYPKEIQKRFDENYVNFTHEYSFETPIKLKKDSKENTLIIQQALNTQKVVVLPNQPIEISNEGLTLNSENILIFSPKTILTIQPNDLKSYQILRIKNVENVKIYNPKIMGDKHKHLGTAGEWGMGISIVGSENIEIYSPIVNSTWGDGIYIGPANKIHSKNVKIYNAIINDARRNGMSITSAENVIVENAIISNTDGTNPKAGIDVEPNSNKDIIENINFKNINTFKNKSHGIILSLSGLIGEVQKAVSINIQNHFDYQSKSGFAIGATGKKSENDGFAVKGYVNVENSLYIDNYYKGIEIYKSTYNNINLKIHKPKILNKNKIDQNSVDEYQKKMKNYYQK